MPNGIEVPRRENDFLFPLPRVTQKLAAFLAAAPSYDEGIDESKFQYSATRKVDHAAALAGGVTFTAIRVSNCMTADPYFEPAWQDAMAAGMPIVVYANIQGYKSGVEQAEFAMRTADPFIKACKHKVVILGDFEADGLTMAISARQKLALDFLNWVHNYYETGIYSNVKYWGEMYGNLKPPAWAWLWGAHWTALANGTFPSSWDLSRLIIWQYGVWNNHTWAKSVNGNVPDIDKDRWMWSGGSVTDFLQSSTVPPPLPPPPLPAPENSAPFVYFTPSGGSCVIQRASKWYKTSGGLDKPIFAPVGTGTHPKVTSKVKVFPLPVTGDGGQVCYMLLDQVINGETVYVRRQDGSISAG